MRNIFIFIIAVFLLISCKQKKQKFEVPERVISNKVQQLDSLNALSQNLLMPLINKDWVTEYSERIKKQNPMFSFGEKENISYWMVPILEIPADSLVKDSINMLKYISKGFLTYNNATCYVIDDKTPVATFIIHANNKVIPFTPSDFHSYLQNRKIDNIQASDIYFKIGFREKFGMSFLPGIVFLSNNKFMFLCYDDDNIYPINEIYRTLYTDKKYLKNRINRIIRNN
jgi:hypothetical protein